MLYEVNNRGRRLVYNYFNEGGDGYESANVGNGFLMNNGYTVIWGGWMHGESRTGSPAAPASLFAQLPVATDEGMPIVGMAREEWIRDTAPALSSLLTYPAASLDQTKATLTYRQNEASPRKPLSTAHWSYADDRTVKVAPPPDADAGTIYEFIYQATQPVVAGLGFAAIRDLVSFLRYTAADDAGKGNPLFVNGAAALKVAVSTGTSQSGRRAARFHLPGLQSRRAGPKSIRRHEPDRRRRAQNVCQLPVRAAGPLHATARRSYLSDGRVSVHLLDDHRSADRQDRWPS